jgi:mono/diheme cytochrome c family protein
MRIALFGIALAFTGAVGCSSSSEETDAASTDTDAVADTDAATDTEDSGDGSDTSDTDVAADPDAFGLSGDASNGSSLYANKCASCHGAMGGGGFGPSLVDAVAELEKSEVANIIRNGQGSMSGFDDLSDQEVADLVAHMFKAFD